MMCDADLEFNPDVNAGLDGDALVDRLLAVVAAAVHKRFDIKWSAAEVLELDSSTPQKFSRRALYSCMSLGNLLQEQLPSVTAANMNVMCTPEILVHATNSLTEQIFI